MEKVTLLLIKTGLALNIGLRSVQNPEKGDVWGTTGLFQELAGLHLNT